MINHNADAFVAQRREEFVDKGQDFFLIKDSPVQRPQNGVFFRNEKVFSIKIDFNSFMFWSKEALLVTVVDLLDLRQLA